MSKQWQVPIVYIVIHMGLMFFNYPSNVIASTRSTHWLPILIGYLLHVAALFVYLKGMSYFGNENIVMFLMKKSKLLARVTLLPLLLSLSIIIILLVRSNAEVISIVFLSNTPLWILIALMLLIPAYMVLQGGLNGLLRTGLVLSILFVPPIIFVLAAAFQNIDPHYALPLWSRDSDASAFLGRSSYYDSLFSFAGCFLFLGFVPSFASLKPKAIYLASVVLLPLYLLSVYVPIMTLGEDTALQLEFPFFFTIDTIEIDWLMFDRITMFLLLSLLSFVMLYSALILWQMVYIIRTAIIEIRTGIILPVIVALVLVVCLCIPDWKVIERYFTVNAPLWGYVSVATPIIVFLTGRRHVKRMERKIP